MDESRKAFESEIEHSYGEDFLVVDNDGDYANWITADLWEFWVKSRAAIEIELPPTVDGSNVPFAGNAWNAYRVEAVKSIRATGIKVKE
ncbi:TPA: hypothetical protein QHT96_003742 [Enterobacter roggenkampii]|nr:hypothetical protein [Enterobacter roggenkampii]